MADIAAVVVYCDGRTLRFVPLDLTVLRFSSGRIIEYGSEGVTEPREIASAFAELTQTPLTDAGMPPHLSRLLRHCLDLTEAAAANIVTAGDGTPVACQATTDPACELLKLELEAGSGPALDCLRGGKPIGPVRVVEPSPWPHIAAAARAAGYTTAHAHPMRAGNGYAPVALGALVLYAHVPLDANHRHIAQALADTAAVTIAAARRLADQTALVAQLQGALDSRIIIEQAKGVLAARHHITPEAAFARLREEARNGNQKIHAVAAVIVAGTTLQ